MAGIGAMILDTCALIWLVAGGKEISRATLRKMNESPALYISAITGFEIALKRNGGKLDLGIPADKWLERAIDHHSLSVIALDLRLCIDAANLPPIHSDPCDRLIIATARRHGFVVVTKDGRFEEYGMQVIS